MQCIKAVLLLLLIPTLAWADGALTPAANPPDAVLYDYRSTIEMQDDFIAGTSTTSTIGALGWQFSGGTAALLAPEAGRPGILRRDTSASSGTASYLYLGTATRTFLASETFTQTWIFRLTQTDANTKVRIGHMNSVADASTSGVYLEKLDADTNWFCVTRSASTETRVDSGVATGTGWVKLEIAKSGSGVTWKLNGAQVCGTMTTNVPTAAQFPIGFIINSAAASKTIDFDYFQMKITGLSR